MAIVLLSLPVFIETQVTSRPTSPPSLTPTIPPKNGTSFSSRGHVILLFNLFFLILKNERNPSVLYTLTTPSFIVSHHRSILLLLSANPFKPTYNEREVTYLFFFFGEANFFVSSHLDVPLYQSLCLFVREDDDDVIALHFPT